MALHTTPAKIVKILGFVGPEDFRIKVRVKLLKSPETEKLYIVKGPVGLGDIIQLEETIMDIWKTCENLNLNKECKEKIYLSVEKANKALQAKK